MITNRTKPGSSPVKQFTLVKEGIAGKIYIDPKGEDYDGLRRVAKSFAADIHLVTGTEPSILTQKEHLAGMAVIAGSIGSNDVIDTLIAEGILDVSSIQGKRECYRIQRVEHPVPGVDQALVIAGSDKRGTIYGIYAISERIESARGYTGGMLSRTRSRCWIFLQNSSISHPRNPPSNTEGYF